MSSSDQPGGDHVATARKVVVIPRLTEDQLAFLRDINLSPAEFDRTIVVGGPARSRTVIG